MKRSPKKKVLDLGLKIAIRVSAIKELYSSLDEDEIGERIYFSCLDAYDLKNLLGFENRWEDVRYPYRVYLRIETSFDRVDLQTFLSALRDYYLSSPSDQEAATILVARTVSMLDELKCAAYGISVEEVEAMEDEQYWDIKTGAGR